MAQINCEILAAHLRGNAADLLACLPAARRSAERSLADTACMDAMSFAAYGILRSAHNLSAWERLCHAPPAPTVFRADALVQAFCKAAAAICPQARIACLCGSEPLFVRGNAALFVTVLGNLLCNSLQYAAERPQIVLTLEPQGSQASLLLRDSGKGMQANILESARLPWFSKDPYGDSSASPFLGLGLALAQQYAEAYGGLCALHSTFGEGCALAFSLPLADPAHALASGQDTPRVLESADLLQDHCSVLYTLLCPVCRLPQ